jgi:hypothetical protein
MAKLTTKQAIRQATKKKKGNKPNKVNKIDTNKGNKSNNSSKIGTKGGKGGGKPSINNDVTDSNNTNNQSVEPVLLEILDTKTKMSDKELRFIYFYMAGGISIEQSMILAGYEGYHPKSLSRLGKMIVTKHECQVGDHRKIFRAVGAGETAIAMGLLNLAQNAQSEMVRHNAWNSLAKCLGLSKEVLDAAEGISIVINQGCAPAGDDQPAALELPKPPPPSSGALTITK